MSLLNIDFNKDTSLKKRRGWRTFSEMVKELEGINKRYKKLGVQGDFTIRLPLKGWLQHRKKERKNKKDGR